MLLTPGIITPVDIKKPEITKYIKLNWLFSLEKLYFCSIYTSKIPVTNEKIKNKIFWILILVFKDLISLNNFGILPSISPIKRDFVCIGYA